VHKHALDIFTLMIWCDWETVDLLHWGISRCS